MSSRFKFYAIALLALPGVAMAQAKPVAAPGSSVPQASMAYGGTGKPATSVTLATPLPTAAGPMYPADVVPLAGTSTAAQMVGPFVPILGRPITLALSASTWPGGNAQLLRSTDGGVTKLALTPAGVTIGVYSGPGADSPWVETEAGAGFYLSLPGAGITYRVAQ